VRVGTKAEINSDFFLPEDIPGLTGAIGVALSNIIAKTKYGRLDGRGVPKHGSTLLREVFKRFMFLQRGGRLFTSFDKEHAKEWKENHPSGKRAPRLTSEVKDGMSQLARSLYPRRVMSYVIKHIYQLLIHTLSNWKAAHDQSMTKMWNSCHSILQMTPGPESFLGWAWGWGQAQFDGSNDGVEEGLV
jgi:hypothetical protein